MTAVMLGGATLALVGQALVIVGIALALPGTQYGFLVAVGGVTRLLAASMVPGVADQLYGERRDDEEHQHGSGDVAADVADERTQSGTEDGTDGSGGRRSRRAG
jgi:hypothetical protein